MKFSTHQREESGFTLVEIVVTVLILGVLMAIAVPMFINQRVQAEVASVKQDISKSAVRMEQNKSLNNGVYVTGAGAPKGETLSPNVVMQTSVRTVGNTKIACVQAYHSAHITDSRFYYDFLTKEIKAGVCPTV